jgi:hypothetical protein
MSMLRGENTRENRIKIHRLIICSDLLKIPPDILRSLLIVRRFGSEPNRETALTLEPGIRQDSPRG